MNIAEILKDCPKGTKLYSPVFGEVGFRYIDDSSYPIKVDTNNNCNTAFTSDGRLHSDYNGECMLFPSKDNRDWSTFKVPKKEYDFKPFDHCRFKITEDEEFCYADYWYIYLIYNPDQLYIIEKWED